MFFTISKWQLKLHLISLPTILQRKYKLSYTVVRCRYPPSCQEDTHMIHTYSELTKNKLLTAISLRGQNLRNRLFSSVPFHSRGSKTFTEHLHHWKLHEELFLLFPFFPFSSRCPGGSNGTIFLALFPRLVLRLHLSVPAGAPSAIPQMPYLSDLIHHIFFLFIPTQVLPM